MHPTHSLRAALSRAFSELFSAELDSTTFQITPTRREFEGDYTLLAFPLTKWSKLSPEATSDALGRWMVEHVPQDVVAFNTVKGFLNLALHPAVWARYTALMALEVPHAEVSTGERVLVEYASPNTNKPLHLGHVRNILLGWSMSRIMERIGHEVIRVQVINDRGIAICKSMLAWKKFGEGRTPASEGVKGDHFVGDFYVRFEEAFREEYADWQNSAEAEEKWRTRKDTQVTDRSAFFKEYKNEFFNTSSILGREARDMLLAWEAGDPQTLAIWRTMNGWVYEGFDATYDRLGVAFDKVYYESDTYLLGNDIVDEGVGTGLFQKRDDGSVWVDLSGLGLDQKILRRSDGTSLYITQDMGTAEERYRDFGANRVIYVVADEQNYHFQVLFSVMKMLGTPYADGMAHLSYGMVELPTGRMKSREGTVVDADDLMDEVISEARTSALERGELQGVSEEEQAEIFRKVGLAAMKFHILKVNARKKMIFDPRESVDMQGHTGPYVQNAYVRIRSILQRTGMPAEGQHAEEYILQDGEKEVMQLIGEYPEAIRQAAEQYDPSQIANFAYALAKAFHRFYHEFPILRAESEAARHYRLQIALATAAHLRDAMDLLGIEMPERM